MLNVCFDAKVTFSIDNNVELVLMFKTNLGHKLFAQVQARVLALKLLI